MVTKYYWKLFLLHMNQIGDLMTGHHTTIASNSKLWTFYSVVTRCLQGTSTFSVATVATDAFQKRLNYNAKEIGQNRENICGDKTHQKLGGHILSQKNQTAISHAMEWS